MSVRPSQLCQSEPPESLAVTCLSSSYPLPSSASDLARSSAESMQRKRSLATYSTPGSIGLARQPPGPLPRFHLFRQPLCPRVEEWRQASHTANLKRPLLSWTLATQLARITRRGVNPTHVTSIQFNLCKLSLIFNQEILS